MNKQVLYSTLGHLVDQYQLLVKLQKMKFPQFWKNKPQTSTRQMSLQLNISKSSVLRVNRSMGYKPYIPRLVHELNEDGFDRWVEYCETFLSLLQNEPDLIHPVIWSDEAILKLNWQINRHNSTYWETENPSVTWEHTMQAE